MRALIVAVVCAVSGCSCDGGASSAQKDGSAFEDAACVAQSVSCVSHATVARTSPMASLQRPLKKVWEQTLGEAVSAPARLAGSKQIVATSFGHFVTYLDESTGEVLKRVSVGTDEPLAAGLAVDLEDNVYYSGRSLYSRDAAGTMRWSRDIGAQGGHVPLLDGTGVFVVGLDGRVRKFRTDNGALLWAKSVPLGRAELNGTGWGDAVIATTKQGYVALATVDGSLMWSYDDCLGSFAGGRPIPVSECILGSSMNGGGYGYSRLYSLDACGTAPVLMGAGAIRDSVVDGNLDVWGVARADNELDRFLFRVSIESLGEAWRSAKLSNEFSQVVAIGNDGHLYVYECEPSSRAQRLVMTSIQDPQLRESEVELGTGCDKSGGAILTADGMLFISTDKAIVAIETPSAGPVAATWSQTNGDARSSGWLP